MDLIEAKLRKLTFQGPEKQFGSPEVETRKFSLESQLKATLRELSSHDDFETNDSDIQKICFLIQEFLAKCNETVCQNKELDIQEYISDAIMIIKAVGENPLSKPPSNNDIHGIVTPTETLDINAQLLQTHQRNDIFWTKIILPNLADIYGFFYTSVISFCDKKLVETSSFQKGDADGHSHGGGFEHHQLLGLLQKGVRAIVVFLKRGTLNPETWNGNGNNERLFDNLNKIGCTLCSLFDHPMEVGIDIRCNIGLAMCHLVHHVFKGDKGQMFEYFGKLFPAASVKNSPPKDKSSNSFNNFLEGIKFTASDDINRIGIAVGILSSLDFGDCSVDFSELLLAIGRNILAIDHGSKELINLGCARVLETLTERLSHPSIPIHVLEKVSELFAPMEFFIFSYIPGHIDAVKNCCRNMLSSLTRIYDRIITENARVFPAGGKSEDLIERLLQKVLSKDSHVKWISLACVTKNSAKSVKVLELDPSMPISILCPRRTCRNAANECYIALMSHEFTTLPLSVWEQRWVAPLFLTQIQANDESNWPQKKAIISHLLKTNQPVASVQIMLLPILRFVIAKMNAKPTPETERWNSQENNAEGLTEAALLAAETIKIASEIGLKIELETTNTDEDSFRGLVPRAVLNSWLWNENAQIRLAGFSLLAESKKTSEIISKQDFESLKISLKYSFVSQTPAFRQQFLAYFKKLLVRLRDSQSLLRRKRDTASLENYSDFFKWIWKFLVEDEGMFVGANFGRRCQSLECLAELVISFPDFSIFGVEPDPTNIKYLQWLVDTYENNKMKVLEILTKLPMPAFDDSETCDKILKEALSLCESIRPPESVTGRYLTVLLMKKKSNDEKYSALNILNKLIEKLEYTLERIRSTSLKDVSCDTPMYGLIRCIRMIITETSDEFTKNPKMYKEFSEKIIHLLLTYDDLLIPVLGNAAPEGSLPDLPDSQEDNSQVVRSITAQMVLVCSWRTMRDTCLLMADICMLFPLEGEKIHWKKNPSGEFILSVDQVSKIGGHMLYLLRNLVHRGVFEQVFVGFKTLATRLWKSSNPQLSGLPAKWLEDSMDEEHMNSKSITRRSAGLPFIFQALLSAESDNEAFLHSWIQRLFIQDESPEMSTLRIHVMNVLRGLFRDANFSKAMMPFVPHGLRIAFRGLKSENWNERNAGLMLYGALLRRAFGPKLNLMSAPTFFRRFPQMYDFLLGELELCLAVLKENRNIIVSESQTNGPQKQIADFTFHLLLLLSSFAPAGRVEDDHFKLAEFIPMLRECAFCSDIEVRKLAAKAIIPFLSCPTDTSAVLIIMKNLKDTDLTTVQMNYLHGSFTQIAVIMKYVKKDQSTKKIIEALDELLSVDSIWKLKCPTVYESLADIILAIEDFSNPLMLKIYQKLISQYDQNFPQNIKQRNAVPGLLIADSRISQMKVLMEFSRVKTSSDSRKLVYDWINQNNCASLTEQLLDYLCSPENANVIDSTFNSPEPEGCVVLDLLVRAYLQSDINYVGQSVSEFKFLDVLTKVRAESYNLWLTNTDTEEQRLLDRITEICTGGSSTTEHKRLALRLLCRFAFETDVVLTEKLKCILCKLLVDWSDSAVDDDLRYGAALSIPTIPFNNLSKFSIKNQGMIWLTILKLMQDDDPDVRSIISSKILTTSEVSCDRRSLEKLTDTFFENFVNKNPLEGLTLLVGLLFRDDFELKTEDAQDDEEGRLFDKSEMNMFCEPITFAKTVLHNMSRNPIPVKEYFNMSLSVELVELYELTSYTKLFISSPTLESIIDIMKLKLQYDNDDGESTEKVFCTPSSPLSNRVHSRIIDMIRNVH